MIPLIIVKLPERIYLPIKVILVTKTGVITDVAGLRG
jgi:hypothetical protein